MSGCHLRGVWRYSINNAVCALDNGIEYTAAELAEYKKPHPGIKYKYQFNI